MFRPVDPHPETHGFFAKAQQPRSFGGSSSAARSPKPRSTNTMLSELIETASAAAVGSKTNVGLYRRKQLLLRRAASMG